MKTLTDRIPDLQRELDLLEVPYTRALQREKGEDPEWEERKKSLIRQMCDLIIRFKIGDEPHKAVAICAQAQAMAAELRAPAAIVDQYEERKKVLTMAYAERERHDKAVAEAERMGRREQERWGSRRQPIV